MKPRIFFCLSLTLLTLLHPLLQAVSEAGLFRNRRVVQQQSSCASGYCAPVYHAPYLRSNYVNSVAVSTAVTTTQSNILDVHHPSTTTITTTQVSPIVSNTIPAVATISEQKVLVPAINFPYSFTNALGAYAYNPYAPQYGLAPGAAYQFAYQQPAQPAPAAATAPAAAPSAPQPSAAGAGGKNQYDQLVVDVAEKLVTDQRLYAGIARAIKTTDEPAPPAPAKPDKPAATDGAGLSLLKQNCASCHTEGSPKLKGKMPVMFSKSGDVNRDVLAKNSTAIIDAIRDGRMPPKGVDPATGKAREPLGQDDYWAIKTWLEETFQTQAAHRTSPAVAFAR